MEKKCLNCGYVRKASDIGPEYECPKCGAIYAKVEALLKKDAGKSDQKFSGEKGKTNKAINPPGKMAKGPDVKAKGEIQKSSATFQNSNEGKLIECPSCGNKVSKDATFCPKCGHPLKKTTQGMSGSGLFFLIVGAIIVAVIILSLML